MAKRVTGRAIKSMRNYTIEEAAEVLKVSVVTVRGWEKRGLPVLKGQRPYLIVGCLLKAFLEKDVNSRKKPLALNQFYCAPCKQRVTPMGDMADYLPSTPTSGRLSGLCPVCERSIQRFTSKAALPEFEAVLDIATRGGECA